MAWGCVLIVVGGVLSVLLGGYFTFVFFFKRYSDKVEKERRQERMKHLRFVRREQQKIKRFNKKGHGQSCSVMPYDDDLPTQQENSNEKSKTSKQTVINKYITSDKNDTQLEEVDTTKNSKISRNLPKLNEVSRGLPKNTPDIKPRKLPMIKTGTNVKTKGNRKI